MDDLTAKLLRPDTLREMSVPGPRQGGKEEVHACRMSGPPSIRKREEV